MHFEILFYNKLKSNYFTLISRKNACPHPNKIVRYRTFQTVLNKVKALKLRFLQRIALFGIGIG
jgi:hypothetical protein